MPLDPDKEKKTKPSDIGDEERDSGPVSPNGNFKKYILVFVVIGVIAVAWVGLTAYSNNQKKSKPPATSQPSTQQQSNKQAQSDGDKPWLSQSASTQKPPENKEPSDTKQPQQQPQGVTPGIKDISQNTKTVNDTPVSPDTFVKDLNGLPVEMEYKIQDITSATDFVTYVKKRAVTGDGIELYWLDATYKGKPAKIQVPFRIFKELDPEGVTVVTVEIVRVKGADGKDHDIATAFVVRDDYKKILDQKK